MATDDMFLNPNDLMGFSQQVQQADPYGMISQSLGAWQPNMSTWSPVASGATSFGKAFLSGLLGNYARQNASDQLGAVLNVLPQLRADPLSVAAPEGVDANAFNTLKGTAAVKNYQQKALLEDANSKNIGNLMQSVLGKGVENGTIDPKVAFNAIKTGNYDEALSGSSNQSTNFNTPQGKQVGEIERKYTDTLLTGAAAKEALNMNRASTNVLEAIKQDNPLAASTAIFELAKLQDPTGTVREADELRVSDPGGPLGKLAQVFNEIQAKGKITADGKRFIREVVPILQKNAFTQYDQVKSGFLESAKQYGGNPERIQYVKPADLSSLLTDPVLDPVSLARTIVSQGGDARAFAEKASAAGIPKDQARAAWNALQGRG